MVIHSSGTTTPRQFVRSVSPLTATYVCWNARKVSLPFQFTKLHTLLLCDASHPSHNGHTLDIGRMTLPSSLETRENLRGLTAYICSSASFATSAWNAQHTSCARSIRRSHQPACTTHALHVLASPFRSFYTCALSPNNTCAHHALHQLCLA